MTVDYEVTMADLIDFNIYHARHSPAMQRQLFISRIVLSIVTAILTLVAIYLLPRGNEPLDLVAYGIACLAGVIIFLVYPRLALSSVKKNVQRLMSEGQNKGMIGQQRLALTPEALICTSDSGIVTLRWSAVERVIQTEDRAYIYVSATSAHIVPAKAFDDRTAFDEFIQMAQSYCQAQGNTKTTTT